MNPRLRRTAQSTAAWVFGLAVTVLFISLWGRATVVDTESLSDSLAPMTQSAALHNRVKEWLTAELAGMGVVPSAAKPAIDQVLQTTAVARVLDDLLVEMIDAAADPDPAGSSVDMALLLQPAVPEITTVLNNAGVPASAEDVARAVSGLDPLVIRAPGSGALIGRESPFATRLGTAAVLAMVTMLIAGTVSVRLSDDRIFAIRQRLNGIAVSGLTFGVILKVGGWLLDPDGGRAPVSESLSRLADAKWLFPMIIGLVAAALAAGIRLWRGVLRREEASRSSVGPPTPREESPLSRSGSR